MNFLDFILLGIIAVALVRGLIRGMIRQVASLLGIIVGFVAAGHLHLPFHNLVKAYLPSVPYLEAFSYIAVFAAVWLFIILLGLLFIRLSRAMLMGWADRLLGGFFGLLKGIMAAIVLVAVLTLFLPGRSQVLTGSLLSAHAQRTGSYLVRLTPKDLRHRYQIKHEAFLRQLKLKQITRKIKKVRH